MTIKKSFLWPSASPLEQKNHRGFSSAGKRGESKVMCKILCSTGFRGSRPGASRRVSVFACNRGQGFSDKSFSEQKIQNRSAEILSKPLWPNFDSAGTRSAEFASGVLPIFPVQKSGPYPVAVISKRVLINVGSEDLGLHGEIQTKWMALSRRFCFRDWPRHPHFPDDLDRLKLKTKRNENQRKELTMQLTSRRPDYWSPLTRLRDELNRVFYPEAGMDMFEGWFPPVDVREDKDKLTVKAELPGLKREDINVSLHENTLILSGEKRCAEEDKRGDSYQSERCYGRFHRTMTLPWSVEPGKIDASFRDGVLTVILPKSEQAKPKQIDIKVA